MLRAFELCESWRHPFDTTPRPDDGRSTLFETVYVIPFGQENFRKLKFALGYPFRKSVGDVELEMQEFIF